MQTDDPETDNATQLRPFASPLQIADERGITSKFTAAVKNNVIANIISGMDTIPAIESAGISRTDFYRQIKFDPDYQDLFKNAQIERDSVRNTARLESAQAELHRRAVVGWEEPVFDIKGNHCGNKRRYSDACLIFMLKALKPEMYSDKAHTLIQNNVTITPKDEKEMMAEWRRRLGGPA
mgnify:FL=1